MTSIKHLRKIKDSIIALESNVDVNKIGKNHIQHGESELNKDTTGKSLMGNNMFLYVSENDYLKIRGISVKITEDRPKQDKTF